MPFENNNIRYGWRHKLAIRYVNISGLQLYLRIEVNVQSPMPKPMYLCRFRMHQRLQCVGRGCECGWVSSESIFGEVLVRNSSWLLHPNIGYIEHSAHRLHIYSRRNNAVSFSERRHFAGNWVVYSTLWGLFSVYGNLWKSEFDLNLSWAYSISKLLIISILTITHITWIEHPTTPKNVIDTGCRYTYLEYACAMYLLLAIRVRHVLQICSKLEFSHRMSGVKNTPRTEFGSSSVSECGAGVYLDIIST